MRLLLLYILTAAPAPAPAHAPPTADQCDQLWDDTVAAAAPDLEPTDDLRKSYLARERASLELKCKQATTAVLQCPAEATKVCSVKFPTPTDGGRALGLATCVWPEVQACVQRARIAAGLDDGSIPALLAALAGGKLAPDKGGLVKLAGADALLSLRGEALSEKRGNGSWLLLISRRAGARIDGTLVRSDAADPLPKQGELKIAGLKVRVVSASAKSTEVSTAAP